jgi:hypothetical protein
MDNKNLIKASIMFGGGFLLFLALKSSAKSNSVLSTTASTPSGTASFDSTPAPTQENAKIVMTAYTDALKNGEPPHILTELNQEMMKEFGMRCYIDNSGQMVVCDVKGDTVSTK